MPTPTFKNEAEAISQLDAINLDRPGEITISLTASEVSNIGALLDRAAQGLLPAVLGGNELALRLASDTVEIADKLRKLAVAKWG